MLKRFLDGLIFGTGLAIAFVMVTAIGWYLALPKILSSTTVETRQPTFDNPKEAVVAEPQPGLTLDSREFSFYKDSGARMQVPAGGGILSMSPVTTAKGAKRPSTYQLWLTENKLWQIRTTEDKVEIEELPHTKGMQIEAIDKLMSDKVGLAVGRSSMTVSSQELRQLKSTGNCGRDEMLNGEMKISTEGVVFVLPNPYSQ